MEKGNDKAVSGKSALSRIIRPYLSYLRIAGFYPLSSLFTGQSFSYFFLPLSILCTLVSLFCVFIDLFSWIAVDYRLIIKMEFFSLLQLLQRLFFTLNSPMVYVYMIHSSKRIQKLVNDVAVMLAQVAPVAQLRSVKVFVVGSLFWTELCVGLAVAALMMVPRDMSETLNKLFFNGGWDKDAVGIFNTIAVICNMILSHNNIAPHMFVLALVLVISLAFANIHKRLCIVLRSSNEKQIEENCQILSEQMIAFRKVVRIVREFNDIFGGLVLFNCIKDIVVIVSFIAFNLRGRVEQDDDEDNGEFLLRAESDKSMTAYMYYTGVTGILMAALRLIVLIGCNGEVRRISKTLEAIGDQYPDSDLDALSVKFQQEIAMSENTAISAAGFFAVSKEYLITVVGAVLSYFILIYQTRDQKNDMADLIKEKTFKKEMQLLMRNIGSSIETLTKLVRNQTAAI